MAWIQYEPEGNDYVPIEEWGQDHWSTLAYLEHCAVERGGLIDNRKMRTNPRIHRQLVGVTFNRIQDGSKYPTRLRGGIERDRHDDWSCLEDMVAAGLLNAWWRDHGVGFGNADARMELTEAGRKLANQLRQHKASGGNWSDFEPMD